MISDTWSFVSIGIVFKLAVSFLFPKGDTASIPEIQVFSSWRWMQHLIVWSCINRSINHNCNTDLQHLLHCTNDCNFLRCINLELCSKTWADVQICWKEGTLNDNQLNPVRGLLEAVAEDSGFVTILEHVAVNLRSWTADVYT